MTVRLRLTALLATIAFVAVACQAAETPKPAVSGDIDKGNPPTTASAAEQISADTPESTPLTSDRQARLDMALASIPAECEVLSDKNCLLPFPSDFHTRADTSSGTGRRINLPAGQLPNVDAGYEGEDRDGAPPPRSSPSYPASTRRRRPCRPRATSGSR